MIPTTALFYDLDTQLPLGLHRVTDHDHPRAVELFEQPGHCHDLVFLVVDRELGQHHALMGQIGRDEMLLTADGSRRRTSGGVYLFLLKQRLNEAGKKDLLKQIMAG